jgi:hypothetical protein
VLACSAKKGAIGLPCEAIGLVKPMEMWVMEVGQVRQRRLSDDIVAQLETMILEGTLRVGERLPAERALAEQFGVSRPSLR